MHLEVDISVVFFVFFIVFILRKMDDWDDEEFVVPVLASNASNNNWDDEEQEEVKVKSTLSAAQIKANAKKAHDEEVRLANVLKYAILEDETPEDKKVRERKQIEDADADLAGELFGKEKNSKSSNSVSSSIAGATLKSKLDHTNFGILCAKKLNDSTAFNVAAFYKSLTEKCQKNLTSESCDEILAVFQKVNIYMTIFIYLYMDRYFDICMHVLIYMNVYPIFNHLTYSFTLLFIIVCV